MIPLSVVFITYNRADLLLKAFDSLRSALDRAGILAEYIVSDDGSDEANRAVLQGMPVDRLLFAGRNQGLGANTNKGLAAASFDLILQVQDDWQYCARPEDIKIALDILDADSSIGIVQLASSMEAEVKEERRLPEGQPYVVFANDQLNCVRPAGLRPYSDQPHLKRRQFCADLGPYLEGVPMTKTELEFQHRVANQTAWYVGAPKDLKLFRNLGEDRTFNPSTLRAQRIERMESIPVIGPCARLARALARRIRDTVRGALNS